MEMKGEQLIPAPQKTVWAALNDPEVLKACVPGCESITLSGENEYQVLMVARVGPVSAKFKGKLTLSDIKPPDSYALSFEGQGGAAGFAKGGAKVRLESVDGGAATILHYVADAQIGGKLAQIGSRLVEGTARKLADEFFAAFAAQAAAKAGIIPAEAPATVLSPEAVSVMAQESISAASSEPLEAKRGLSPWVWIGGLTVVVGAILAAVATTR